MTVGWWEINIWSKQEWEINVWLQYEGWESIFDKSRSVGNQYLVAMGIRVGNLYWVKIGLYEINIWWQQEGGKSILGDILNCFANICRLVDRDHCILSFEMKASI